MPLSGTRDVTPLLDGAPEMPDFDTEPWECTGADVLQAMFEIDDANREALIPRALNPTIPPAVVFTVARFPESPVGPFMLAQTRISCRASVLPRGFLLQAYTDSPAAADALSSRWGYACRVADVRLDKGYHGVTATVATGGSEILRLAMHDPEPISGGDIQYTANMNLARHDGKPVLVQVDPEYRFHRAERGQPEITAFDRTAWRAEGVDPVWPVVASLTQVDVTFPRIRFVLDPSVPAMAGTRKVR